MNKLPLKMNILKTIIDCGVTDEAMIIEKLEPVYGKERQFSRRAVENHLLALLAVGLIIEIFPKRSADAPVSFSATDSARVKMNKLCC